MHLLSSADFFQIFFFFLNLGTKSKCQTGKQVGLDQDRDSVGPDLGPNCLQTLSADDKC